MMAASDYERKGLAKELGKVIAHDAVLIALVVAAMLRGRKRPNARRHGELGGDRRRHPVHLLIGGSAGFKAAEEARSVADGKAAEEARRAAEAKAAREARRAAEVNAAEEASRVAEAKAAEETRLGRL
jgi:hypothetical protein